MLQDCQTTIQGLVNIWINFFKRDNGGFFQMEHCMYIYNTLTANYVKRTILTKRIHGPEAQSRTRDTMSLDVLTIPEMP